MTTAIQMIDTNQARVLVTYGGASSELPDSVNKDANDADVKGWVTEAIRTGGIPGIAAVDADLRDYVVDRFPPTEQRAYNLIAIRPKTPFGT